MGLRHSINYSLSLADSRIVNYQSSNGDLIIFLECWNEKLLKLRFIDCVFFSIFSNWKIIDICEAEDQAVFNKAMKSVYEIIPTDNPYKLYQFIDDEGEPAAYIISSGFIINDARESKCPNYRNPLRGSSCRNELVINCIITKTYLGLNL